MHCPTPGGAGCEILQPAAVDAAKCGLLSDHLQAKTDPNQIRREFAQHQESRYK